MNRSHPDQSALARIAVPLRDLEMVQVDYLEKNLKVKVVNADIMRGRYRSGFETPAAIPANTVVPFTNDAWID